MATLLRLYKSGSTWALWRWTEFVRWDSDEEYIRRLHLIKTPWFAVCLHWILRPDPELWLHDHPVSFFSVILWGGYWELRKNDIEDEMRLPRIVIHKWANFVHALDSHRILSVRPHTLTLCFMGPKVREWGFHTDKGWVYWKDYNKEKYHNV